MKLWGGRFVKKTEKIVDEFNASIKIDQKLYEQDIKGSMAHAKMLKKCFIITEEEKNLMINGLKEILQEIQNGEVEFKTSFEDIHMNIEHLLTQKIGEVGKKLHTARSRNDQVALDIRLYTKESMVWIQECILQLLDTLLTLAKEHIHTVMPGYTHLQRAQPITFGYHMMAYFQMFQRDYKRFEDGLNRLDVLPLGCGALAGTTYETDRMFLKEELGFGGICENAMDAVSDRDFIIEFISSSSILMMHLSRFCEELILWSSSEFNFIEMDDGYSTGSSIMPQKKNPDVAELIRGKTGRIYGHLMSMLTIMKGLPLAYNKDMQEDKIPLLDTVETLKNCILIFDGMIQTMKVNKNKMEKSTKEGFMNATDVADYLVKKGLPFRSAHEIVGKMVLYCIQNKKSIEELNLKELKEFSTLFKEDILNKVLIKSCIASKVSRGATSSGSVGKMIHIGQDWLKDTKGV